MCEVERCVCIYVYEYYEIDFPTVLKLECKAAVKLGITILIRRKGLKSRQLTCVYMCIHIPQRGLVFQVGTCHVLGPIIGKK